MKKGGAVDMIAMLLVVVGALNWGLVGLFAFDLVSFLLGDYTIASRVVYVLVATAGLYVLLMAPKMMKE